MVPSRLALLAALAALAAGCPRKEEHTPPIAVSPSAPSRIALIPSRLGRAPADRPKGRASAQVMAPGQELGGPNATGRPGDWVLANAEVVFVFDQLGQGAGFAESGGNLVDAADAKVRRDELGQLFTYFGSFPRQAVYDRMSGRDLPDGGAEIVVEGKELFEPGVRARTVYHLGAEDRALLVTTTLVNRGASAVDLGLGDAVQWGGTDKVAPGKPTGFKGASKTPYVGGVGRFVSYALTTPEGEIAAVSGGTWTDTEQEKVHLEPGKSVEYARVFVVGERPDRASVVSELTRAAGGSVGGVEVALEDAAHAKLSAPPGARAALFVPGGGPEVLDLVATTAGFVGEVPPGRYEIAFAPSVGRVGLGGRVPIVVREGAVTPVTLGASAEGRFAGRCRDAAGARSPCKVSFVGREGTATPDFGPAHAAGPAKSFVTSHDGDVDVALAPGTYAVAASRGPEFALAEHVVTVTAGATTTRELTLERVVDTSGWIAADFHQHTMLGADAPTGTRDRVIGNAAEGVEIAVASEHNAVVDLGAVVRDLGLQAELVSIPGNELTTDASRAPWGHANVFPLAVRAGEPRGGATAVRDRTAKDVFDEVRKAAPGAVLQINHPRAGKTGYFDALELDPVRGVGRLDRGYVAEFDALEVWNGRDAGARDKVIGDFFAILASGRPTTPTGNTDTHGVVGQEAGYPRTYVRVKDDAHLAGWDASRSADLVARVRDSREVFVTNGPFVRLDVGGVGIGGVAKGRVHEVTVKVEAAPWVDVTEVELRLVRAPKPAERAPVEVVGPRSVTLAGARSRAAEVRFKVTVDRDAALVAVARGRRPLSPVLLGDLEEIRPFAMTGAVWIDAGGDGVALGRARR